MLGPVSIWEEMHELNLAGRYGWHSVELGIAHHRVVHSETQWEHQRVTGAKHLASLTEEGWEIIGQSSPPYTFLKRDTEAPAR